ncbi:MAG: winged helix-turn-helix transcriptional regulator [Thermoplasmata archaeon]|nr:winged helix-turn-helix transcriptional regulator [Thermoplasmata archaeon]
MVKGVGKALASAIKDEDVQASAKKSSKHIFLNSHRRDIYSALTLTPCIGISQLASRTDIAQNTVEWHLESLIKAGYVSEHRIGHRRIFFPQGLVAQDEIEFFYILNLPRLVTILFKVIEGSGMSQADISELTGDSRQTVAKALSELESAGLVTRVADGNNIRYYSTTLLPDRAEEFYQHSKEFSEHIIKKLGHEGGKESDIVKKGLDRIIIEAGFASGRFTIDIGINPYITCSSC